MQHQPRRSSSATRSSSVKADMTSTLRRARRRSRTGRRRSSGRDTCRRLGCGLALLHQLGGLEALDQLLGLAGGELAGRLALGEPVGVARLAEGAESRPLQQLCEMVHLSCPCRWA